MRGFAVILKNKSRGMWVSGAGKSGGQVDYDSLGLSGPAGCVGVTLGLVAR